ncbi:MAG: 4-fold beta flower protein [Patescibacteria group bacterium]
MIKIVGNDILRSGSKIGWIESNDIFDHSGKKRGYFTENDIFEYSGKKIGWVLGNEIHAVGGRAMRLDDNRRIVSGGSYPDIVRAAIRLILGE